VFCNDIAKLPFQIANMGNTPSDSFNHSFKRIRLSDTEQCSLPSPTSTSPKRKVPLTISTSLSDTPDNHTEDDNNHESPSLLYHNKNSSSSYDSIMEISKPIIKKSYNTDFLSDEEIICLMKSCTTSMVLNDKDIRTNQMTSNEGIAMNLTYKKIIPELSDNDLIKLVKHAYSKKDHK